MLGRPVICPANQQTSVLYCRLSDFKKKTKTCQIFSTLEKKTASEVLNNSDPIRKSVGIEKLV